MVQQQFAYQNTKRIADVFCSSIIILCLIPFYIIISIMIFISIGAPIIYTQERLGKNFQPFRIYKFRTMKRNAEEQNAPQLSSENDDRVVGVGKILRKYRIDELPQFLNVFKGDMSIVGPRPERQFYIQQLQEQVPEYNTLFNVRPGITSSGMVEFGYASNVEEMKQRCVYDIDYMKNVSLQTDLNILMKTFFVVANGKGK